MPDDSLPPSSQSSPPDAVQALRRSRPSLARAWSTPWPTGCAATSSPGVSGPAPGFPPSASASLALGVNRLTLRASLARLEALGLITTRHGAGTVVASWRERAGLETLGDPRAGSEAGGPRLARPRAQHAGDPSHPGRRGRGARRGAPHRGGHRRDRRVRAGRPRTRRRSRRLRASGPRVHACRVQGRAQRRPRALPQHLRPLARTIIRSSSRSSTMTCARRRALSDDRRSHPLSARRGARAQLGTSLSLSKSTRPGRDATRLPRHRRCPWRR